MLAGAERDWPRGWRRGTELARGLVRFGRLRRLTPISDVYGFDRGLPVDRYYIEDFLQRFAGNPQYASGDIQGRVLEVGDDFYTRKFGTLVDEPRAGGVHQGDVLHVSAVNEAATVVGDLETGEGVPEDAYDCVICTQVLHVVYRYQEAIRSLHRALAPGGTVLATVPGITAACVPDRDHWGDWWRFTSMSVKRLFAESFGEENVRVEAYGNVLSATAALHGYAAQDLRHSELSVRDPHYEVLIAVRAVKSAVGA